MAHEQEAHDREVAGIRCTEVLALLDDYVDGQLDPPTRATVDGHLAGCDWCERFGGQYAHLVASVRKTLTTPSPVPSVVSNRLLARLGLKG